MGDNEADSALAEAIKIFDKLFFRQGVKIGCAFVNNYYSLLHCGQRHFQCFPVALE